MWGGGGVNYRTVVRTHSCAAEVWLEVEVLVEVQLEDLLDLPLALLPFWQVVD